VTRTATARRLATATVYGGGSVALGGVALAALLREEARAARRKVEARTSKDDPPSGDGIYGRGRGKPLVFAVLGDSSAVGLGVERAAETPGVLIAAALTELAERPVRLVRLAVTGAESRELDEQVDRALTEHPDVALIMIGANDVTTLTKPAVSVRHLEDAVRRLTAVGCEVVVGTCPDLGTIRPIAQPLRTFARRWSRQMAAAQTIAVVEAGGRTVSLGSVLGPAFASDRSMFSIDEFHPSAAGYAQAAAVLLPSVADAVGVWPASADRGVRPIRRGTVRPMAEAAVRAASRTGTEVQPTRVAGAEAGRRGPWVLLRRRKPTDLLSPEQMEETAEATPSAEAVG
jgi:lysophospholipase L1-like esterase